MTAFDREAFLAKLWGLDAKLVKKGFPATSPWWREQIERFVRSETRRWIVRAGRRAGKSTTLARLAVAWALAGTWSVPPGDVGIVPFVSVSKDEANARLRTIVDILRALGVAHEARDGEVEVLSPRRMIFRVIAATTRAAVGFTSIACFGDEVAKWESRESAANPAREVFSSLVPTLASIPHAFAVLASSPWGLDDFHADSFDLGNNENQIVSHAPTWIANPTISEAQTRELEPDERVWSREYAAEPGATISTALDASDVGACFRDHIGGDFMVPFVAIDASSLRGDAFAYIAGATTSDGNVGVFTIDAWSGDQLRDVNMTTIVDEIARVARQIGATTIFADQREEASLRAMFGERELAFRSFAWTETSKDTAVMTLRRLMRERRVAIRVHPQMRRELLGLKARLMPSGRTKYLTNGIDHASALITLMHAIDAQAIPLALMAVHPSSFGAFSPPGFGSIPHAGFM
ncbi:MAG TPA: hypothetical protein VH062_07635 [Polyangiaceae bacterium]|nr:hypothetical protein [Polyangiaceae bacterium]